MPAAMDDESEAEMDLDTPEGVQAAIAELFPKKDMVAVDGSVEEFGKLASLFVAWLEKNKPAVETHPDRVPASRRLRDSC